MISNTFALPITSIRVTFFATSTVKNGEVDVYSAFKRLRLSYRQRRTEPSVGKESKNVKAVVPCGTLNEKSPILLKMVLG